MPDHKTISANGLDFAYNDAGEGPLALCLHGFPDSPHSMRHLLPALADAGFHAVAPYMRGYAPTGPAPDGKYHMGALVADACALHDAFGGGSDAVLIGSDWGALTTYGAGTFAPERWAKVVTLAIPPTSVMGARMFSYDQLKRFWYQLFFQNPMAEAVVQMDDMAFIDGLWGDWSPGFDGGETLNAAKDAIRDAACLTATLSYYRATLDPAFDTTGFEEEQLAALGTPQKPVLYLHGSTDGCVAGDVVDEVSDVLPEGSKAERIDGAGHFLHVEQPDRVNGLILDFLTG